MVDRSKILSEIFERNRIRQAAQLPLLDVRAEFASHVLGQTNTEYWEALNDALPGVRERLREKYIEGVRRRRKEPDWGPNMIDRMGVEHHLRKVLRRIYRSRTGEAEPHYDSDHILVRWLRRIRR